MKIAVTSEGETMDSLVDPRMGRSRGFIIADEEGEEYEYVGNPRNPNTSSDANVQAAKSLIELGVDAVITGMCHPAVYGVLLASHIRIYTGASGTVREALEEFRKGHLSEAEHFYIEGHWL